MALPRGRLQWTGDCTYRLKFLESSAVYPETIDKLRKSATLTVEILNWTDRYYVYSCSSDVIDRVIAQRNTIILACSPFRTAFQIQVVQQ